MTEEEIQKEEVEHLKKLGQIWRAKYVEMFGYKEPLYGTCIFESHRRDRERIAKICVEQGKTATELGLYPTEHDVEAEKRGLLI